MSRTADRKRLARVIESFDSRIVQAESYVTQSYVRRSPLPNSSGPYGGDHFFYTIVVVVNDQTAWNAIERRIVDAIGFFVKPYNPTPVEEVSSTPRQTAEATSA